MGELLPVLAALLVSLVGTVVVARLPEPNPCAADPGPTTPTSIRKLFGLEPRDCVRAGDGDRPSTLQLVRMRGVAYVLLLYFLVFLGFNFFYTAFPVHAAVGLGWTVLQTGAFFAVLSFLMVLVQGPLLKRIAPRVSESTLIVVGNALLAAAFVVLTSPSPTLIYTGAVLFALGNGVMWPSVLSTLSALAGEDNQGAVHGLAGALGSLAGIVGLIAGGVLYGAIGAATFLLSAGTIFTVALLSTRLWHLMPTAGSDA
jgi:predicted MFS family arabinose efflux permease